MPGSLFVARRGVVDDGRRFIRAAAAAGAVAVLTDDASVDAGEGVLVLVTPDVNAAAAIVAERFYGEPSSKLKVVGVTGTNGKTTIAYLVHRLLNGMGVRCGMISTVQVDDGNEVAPATLTTPPAIEISRTLGVMAESACAAGVMEVSSHALDQGRVAGVRFDVGVFTNLTGDHLDYHRTMEHYAAAKAGLFAMLAPGAAAVINVQDPWHGTMVAACRPGVRVLTCAVGEGASGAECVGRAVRGLGRSMVVELLGPWGKVEAEVPLVGAHNVMNILQAVAAVWGVSPWGIGDGDPINLAAVAAPPGRLQLVSAPGEPVAVYVDYAHSDDALKNVLGVLRGVSADAKGKLWCVFGCGGDRDRTKRPRMGRVAAELADVVVVTSDNPRTERPRAIIDEIVGGVLEAAPPGRARSVGEDLFIEEDRERAIKLAVRRASPGDVVLIAGKGHENYQILPDGRGGTVRRDFDDRLVAREALEARFGSAGRGKHGDAAAGGQKGGGGGGRRGLAAAVAAATPRRHEADPAVPSDDQPPHTPPRTERT